MVSIFNPTGGKLFDLYRLYQEYHHKDTASIINLRKVLIDLHKDGYKNIHLIVHSEGGMIARRAMEVMPWNIREKMSVHTLGSPIKIPNCYAGKVDNYESSRDWIKTISRFALIADKLHGHQISYSVLQCQHSCFAEHSIHSPTYMGAMEQIFESIALSE